MFHAKRRLEEQLDPATDTCPECQGVYDMRKNSCTNRNCGFSLAGYRCERCGEPLTLDDYAFGDGEFCDYCEHVMTKDD